MDLSSASRKGSKVEDVVPLPVNLLAPTRGKETCLKEAYASFLSVVQDAVLDQPFTHAFVEEYGGVSRHLST